MEVGVIVTPNTTVDVLGGTATENQWGDEVDGTEVILQGIPAALVENPRQVVADEGQREPVTIVYVICYVPRRYDVTSAQRIRDNRTGTVYLVDKVTRPLHSGIPQDTRLDLRNAS